MTIIVDGSGSGFQAKVTKANQLSVFAVTETGYHASSDDGNAYAITSGNVTIGASGTEGILYFKNTGEGAFHVDSIIFANDVAARWVVYRNPTTGTLISGGSAVTPVNLNFNSNNTLTNTSKKGTDASTITDGTAFVTAEAAVGTIRFRIDGAIILGGADSIAMESVVGAAAELAVTILGHFVAS